MSHRLINTYLAVGKFSIRQIDDNFSLFLREKKKKKKNDSKFHANSDNLHEMSNPVCWENKKKKSQNVVC